MNSEDEKNEVEEKKRFYQHPLFLGAAKGAAGGGSAMIIYSIFLVIVEEEMLVGNGAIDVLMALPGFLVIGLAAGLIKTVVSKRGPRPYLAGLLTSLFLGILYYTIFKLTFALG